MLPATEALRSSVEPGLLPVPGPDREASGARPDDSGQRRRGVSLGGYRLLLDGGDVHEVIRYTAPRTLPFTSDLCHGLLNLRGNLVTVYDLRRALRGRAGDADRPRWILVQQRAPAWVGFALTELPLAVRIEAGPADRPEVPLPEMLRRNLKGAYRGDNGLWLDLDWHGLYDELSSRLAT